MWKKSKSRIHISILTLLVLVTGPLWAQDQEAEAMSQAELALRERLTKVEKELATPPDTPENVLTSAVNSMRAS